MTKPWVIILVALVLMSVVATTAEGQASGGPETVVVRNGSVTLHALLWRHTVCLFPFAYGVRRNFRFAVIRKFGLVSVSGAFGE